MSKRRSIREQDAGPITDLEEFKRFIGPLASRYNDAQLRQLSSEMHTFAELLLDLCLKEIAAKRRGNAGEA